MTEPRVFKMDVRHCVSFWSNAVIVDLRADMDVPTMQSLGRAYASLIESYPSGIVVLAFLQATVPVSGPEARAEGARVLNELGGSILRIITIIEDRGVLAHLLKSIVRGVSVLARRSRLSIANDLEEAASELVPLLVAHAPPQQLHAELLVSVDTARRRYVNWLRNGRLPRA